MKKTGQMRTHPPRHMIYLFICMAACLIFTACSPAVSEAVSDMPAITPSEEETIMDTTPYTSYLMAYFTGGAEEIYFGISKDGYNWKSVNHSKAVLKSAVGTTGARDPFIIRSEDGSKFWLLATDLCINKSKDWWQAQCNGSRSMLIWESEDLITWSEPRLVEMCDETFGNLWAPEATYLPELKQYAVYWASRNSTDNYGKLRLWYSLTPDFVTFSEPEVWIDYPYDTIDTTVIRDGDTYYRFTKYERERRVILESTKEFFGTWTEIGSPSLLEQVGVEGPSCYRLLDKDRTPSSNFCLLLDAYGSTGYYIMDTLDISGGEFTKKMGYSLSKPVPRHGSVVYITDEEYERLLNR